MTAALDTDYPYSQSSTSVFDTPGDSLAVYTASQALNSIEYEEARQFDATMFLMWIPTDAANCTASCAIAVPLGSIRYQWSGDTLDSLNASLGASGWLNSTCGSPIQGNFTPSGGVIGYPNWNSVVQGH